MPTFAFWHNVLPPGLSQRWEAATSWASWQKLALSSVFKACCRLGAHRSAHRVHVGALSSSSKPHWTGEQTAAQMTCVSQKSTEENAAESSPVCPSESPIEGLWLPRGCAFVGQQKNTVPIHAPCPPGPVPVCVWTAAIYNAPRKRVPFSMQL